MKGTRGHFSELDMRRAWRHARRAVAAALLGNPADELSAPPVSAWRAWLFVAWLLAVTIGYLLLTHGLGINT